MSSNTHDRLRRVLELEEKQGWRNRAVVGGMAAMADRLPEDATNDLGSEVQVATLVQLMRLFDSEDESERPEIAEAILHYLEGEVTAAQTLLDDDPDEALADHSSLDGNLSADIPIQSEVPPLEPTNVAEERVRERKRSASVQSDSAKKAALATSPEVLQGVGPVTVEQLERLNIHNVEDLLWHLPARYEDYSKLRTIDKLEPGEQVTVIANLWKVSERNISMQRQIVEGILSDATGTLRAIWWNKWVKKQLRIGATMRFSGRVGLYLGYKTLESPVFEDVDEEMVSTGRISPIYRLTEGIQNYRMRSIVYTAVENYIDNIQDPLPLSVREKCDLPDLADALRQVHAPESQDELDSALQRLAFEEFFYLQLGVIQRRRELKSQNAIPIKPEASDILDFLNSLPFELTAAQRSALDVVLMDMARTEPMARLIQGDVGSGKTVVAAAAMVAAFHQGCQTALLAPTQILAEQHYRSICKLVEGCTRADGKHFVVELLTGRVTGAERERVLEVVVSGDADILVGTTAIIQENVEFNRLALAIVDEQHRFGVGQRGALRSKGIQPHLLVMSATPIPRSLALTVFGDLDVSIIDEMPAGRIAVRTKRFTQSEHERVYRFMRKEAHAGRQGFIVYPLVEESESVNAGAAVDEYERLQSEVFGDLRLGLLHGRMTGQEKDAVMTAFVNGEYDVLVSTTVIEVGIDVPNASLIIVEDADRFGLAQLHQLRGRVGRGEHESYCAIFSKAESDTANERLQALQDTSSGFELAEKDLELRGPGDFLGTRQSGLPNLQIASLGDMSTLAAARESASEFLATEDLADYPLLAEAVHKLWSGEGDIS